MHVAYMWMNPEHIEAVFQARFIGRIPYQVRTWRTLPLLPPDAPALATAHRVTL